MPLSKEQRSIIEQAFEQALKQGEDNTQTSVIQFEGGAQELLPLLSNESLHINNYDGVEFNQYRIIKQIGSGGMGNVYLASRNDGQYDKTVAIKVLTKGFNNQNIKDRFLREKQILAQLRHPNIVPLLDAGTTDDGIPWFVLEFIDGDTISQFCTGHELSIESIVDLLIKICDAIHFAHSKGVIHRDLKPANILIENRDGELNPIILDFGIAHQKDSAELTNQGNLMGTPGYMSPEQIKGIQRIDRRSDIFSLGVVLYQLFSGVKPFQAESTQAVNQKSIHENPTKLVKIIPSFPKDLQIIVDTCLKKKRNERYQTALNLKQDLENWLNGYPIMAKKESLLKSTWLLLKRNTLVSTLSLSMLFFGVLSAIKYTYDIKQERQIAIQANAESDDLFNFLLKDLHTELAEIGRVDLLQSVAQKNLQHLNKYHFKLSNDEKLKYVAAYRNIASVLEMQQDTTPSISAYSRARDILLELENTPSHQNQQLNLLALTYTDLAGLHAKLGLLDLANSEHETAQQQAKKLQELNASNAAETLWTVIHPLSWNLMEQSQYKQAKIYLDQALAISSQELSTSSNSSSSRQWLTKKFKSLIALGWYYIDIRKIDSAIQYYKQAMLEAQQLLLSSPNSVPFINNLQKTNNQIAYAYVLNKDYDNAIIHAQQAVTHGELLHIRAPDNHVYYRALSYSFTMLGNAYNEIKEYGLAEDNFKDSLEITQQIASAATDNTSLQNDLAVDMLNFADLLGKKGDKIGEKNYWQKAEKILETIATTQDASIYYVDTYVYVLLIQGKIIAAKPYLLRMKNTDGWPNESYQKLVKEYELTELLNTDG